MILNDFSGGLNLRLDPTKANPNEATVATNINLLSTALQPIQQPIEVLSFPSLVLDTVYNYKTSMLGKKSPQSYRSKLLSFQGNETRVIGNGATFLETDLYFISNSKIYPKLLVTTPTSNTLSYLDFIVGTTTSDTVSNYGVTLYDTVLDVETPLAELPVKVDTPITFTGTYSQSGTTITVTKVAHGLSSGNKVNLDFTTGTALDIFGAITVTGADTFTIVASNSATTSGNVSAIAYNKSFSIGINFTGNNDTIPTWGALSNIVIRIYRIGNNLVDFTKVVELDPNNYTTIASLYGLSGNSYVYTIIDQLPDLVASTNIVYNSTKVITVPYGADYFTEYLGATFAFSKGVSTTDTLFSYTGAVLINPSGTLYTNIGNKATITFKEQYFINFTNVGTSNFFATNYFTSLEEITGFGKCSAGLFIFTANSVRLLTGGDSSTYVLNVISDSVGCTSHFSISNYHGLAIWTDGLFIYGSTGYAISNLSISKIQDSSKLLPLDIQPTEVILTDYNSLVVGDSYYLAVSKARYKVTDIYTQQEIIDVLVRYNLSTQTYSVLDLGTYKNSPNLNPNFDITPNNSILLSNNSRFGYYDITTSKTYEIKDFIDTSKSLETIHWKSEKLTDGSLTLPKIYDFVRLAMYGAAYVTIYIDDVAVVSNELVDTGDIKTFSSIQIKLPQEDKRGYSIQFEITGICNILEINYGVSNAITD